MAGPDGERNVTGAETEPDAGDSNRRAVPRTRRRVLQGAAAAGVFAGFGAPASAQENRIELGGNTSGWEGRAPEAIAGETNPTLELEEGTTYVLEWENVDGQPHNFVIEDADGNEIVRTAVISEQGATQTVEFEATRAMSEYYCEVHPQTMRGDVSLGPAPDDGDDGAVDDGARFFEEGATVGVTHVAEGMTAPTDFAAVPGTDLLLITDQTGEVWAADADGRLEAPVADLSDRMVELGEFRGDYASTFQDYDERGLLGIDLHPDFLQNGRLFLHYSAPATDDMPENWSHVEVVSEFSVNLDELRADPISEQRLLEFQKPQYNHDAGPMAFGPDGYLYVPMGDGGGANDEMYGHVDDWYDDNAGGNGQDTSENLLGGIHRIDVDAGGDGDRPYGIPDDNPLVGMEGHRDEYYAWGFRNPFGITFDSQGRMIVADAGQNLFEEASVVESGGNYGWNVKEGTHCFSTDDPGQPPEDCPDSTPDDVRGGEDLIDPVVEYPHNYRDTPVGIVIAGGHVYEAGAIDDLQGKYVFGDWTRDVGREEPDGRLFAADPGATGSAPDDGDGDGGDGDQVVPREELWAMEELQIAGSDDGNLHRFVRQFGQGPNGDVYVLVNERGTPEDNTGAVLRIVPPGEGDEIGPVNPPDDGDDDGGGNGDDDGGSDGDDY